MFAGLYHAHHSLDSEDLPFWLDLARQPADPLLELGCGTGRVLVPLALAGHTIVGLDLDREMLLFLRLSLPAEARPRAHIFQADFTRFRLELRFGLLLLPCNTYSTLESRRRLDLLSCVRRHLRPDGWFAVSLPNPPLLKRLPASSEPEIEQVFPHPLDGEPVQASSAWERTPTHFIVHWHYDHLLPDGRVERTSAETRHTLTSAQTYRDEMISSGFEVLSMYGDFDRSRYTSGSPHLILVARPAPAKAP
jgi:SAM-dependent methyltransferase